MAYNTTQLLTGVGPQSVMGSGLNVHLQKQSREQSNTNIVTSKGVEPHAATEHITNEIKETFATGFSGLADTFIGKTITNMFSGAAKNFSGYVGAESPSPEAMGGAESPEAEAKPTWPMPPGARLTPSRTPQTPASAVEPAIGQRAQQAKQEAQQARQERPQGNEGRTREVVIKVVGDDDRIIKIINLQLGQYGSEDMQRITTGAGRF